jgi:CRP-like cAMP-binding protein
MPDSTQSERNTCNELLNTLDDREYRLLAPHLQLVHVRVRDVAGQRGTAPAHVYFPCTGVFSVLSVMADGSAVEVGTIGREGFVGTEILIGGAHWTETVVCQIEGDAPRNAICWLA